MNVVDVILLVTELLDYCRSVATYACQYEVLQIEKAMSQLLMHISRTISMQGIRYINPAQLRHGIIE